jgi:hypothetical protein
MTLISFGTKLIAGDAWGPFTVSPCDYTPDAGYTLKLLLRGTENLDLTAAVDGSSFVVSATSTQTKDLPGGIYAWTLAVYKDSDRTTLAQGTVEVLADLETQSAGVETRSWVEQALAAVRAVIAGTAGRKEEEYQVAGRMMRLRTPRELMELERTLAWKLHFMQIADGQKPAGSGTVQFGFGDPGCRNGGWHQ